MGDYVLRNIVLKIDHLPNENHGSVIGKEKRDRKIT